MIRTFLDKKHYKTTKNASKARLPLSTEMCEY